LPTTQRTAKVLVLSREPLVAALVGMMLELEAYEPTFAGPEESPEDAVTRVRPLFVVLLDGGMDAAGSDLFFARVAKRRVPVVLFAEPAASADVEELARARGLPCLVLPADRSALARVLRSTGTGGEPRSGSDRRRAPSAYSAPDGTLIYHDRTGQRWFVYDRRTGSERRSAGRSEPTDQPHRAFISESGEEWRFPIARGQPLEATASALEWQLARATRVEED
jgi:hypothetical protein